MLEFINKNKMTLLVLSLMFAMIIGSLILAFSPLTQKGSQYLSNLQADTEGKNRMVLIYNCETNEIIDKFSDKNMRFETLGDGKGVRFWLGTKNQKIGTNMCWLVKDIVD